LKQTTSTENKTLVLEAFDTLFNKRDFAGAECYWSPNYIQHSVRSISGERLHTENSHKFTTKSFADLAAQAGWSVRREWISAAPQFAIFSLVPPSLH
jgi:hypothetical protein